MTDGNHRNRKLESIWRRHVKRQPASGLSIRGYCCEHDLHESAFYFWRREIATRDQAARLATPAFVPVTVVEAPVPTTSTIDIRLASGHRVRVRTGCDRQLLADVVAVLEAKPC